MAAQNIGSSWVSVEEATAMLNLSENGLRGWVRKGIVQVRYEGRKPYFPLEEISALAALRGTRTDVATGILLAQQALATTRRLADEVRELRTLAGLTRRPLDMTIEAACELSSQAEAAIQEDGPIPERELRAWADRFLDLDEAYLGWIAQVLHCNEPWKVFLDLGARLSARAEVSMRPRGGAEEGRLHAWVHLALARDHLRRVAYFYCRQKYGIRVAHRMVGDDLAERLLRLAAHTTKPARRKRARRRSRPQP
ncbi:helix-turn-helix domain-containing protein [Pendulispora rubella]|uniref:Helix-turn-helix domain-containing protein n=1 Tax=Pendulispora rubella TaxID=2741070 RepID=A0ABZ2KYJ4_9BACT